MILSVPFTVKINEAAFAGHPCALWWLADDRMLVAQAKDEALLIVTDDSKIRQYDVQIISPLD
ncbi:MAG: hypothetical protein Q3M30_09980 [Candidatus Electrothrix sp. Rat3]|nr:hypothetical protein [Candidatus Electrothrix rattekaaiensis]